MPPARALIPNCESALQTLCVRTKKCDPIYRGMVAEGPRREMHFWGQLSQALKGSPTELDYVKRLRESVQPCAKQANLRL